MSVSVFKVNLVFFISSQYSDARTQAKCHVRAELLFLSGKICLVIVLLYSRINEMTESVNLNVLNFLGCNVEALVKEDRHDR